MPQKKPRHVSANEVIRRRIHKWEDEDPSSLLTKQIEKATAPLQWLVALMLPDRLIQEALQTTLRAAEALTDRNDVLVAFSITKFEDVPVSKVDQCDALADKTHFWAVGAAAAFGAWDIGGPLGIAPSLASLFTLAFRTIKKIGLCYGYDTTSSTEELVALEIIVAASTLYHRDKVQALKNIQKLTAPRADDAPPVTAETVEAAIAKVARAVGLNLTRRRTFANIPAMGALVGSSTNAWLINDISWAARNIYATRRFQLKSDARQTAHQKKVAEAAVAGTVIHEGGDAADAA